VACHGTMEDAELTLDIRIFFIFFHCYFNLLSTSIVYLIHAFLKFVRNLPRRALFI
jgi:hypothetical protein